MSEIPIWTHQRQFGLKSKKIEKFGFGTRNFFNSNPGGYLKMHWVVAITLFSLQERSWSSPQPPWIAMRKKPTTRIGNIPGGWIYGCLSKRLFKEIFALVISKINTNEISHLKNINKARYLKLHSMFKHFNIICLCKKCKKLILTTKKLNK